MTLAPANVTKCLVPSYNPSMSQSETCKAAWSGGKCDRGPDAARGLCQGHYAQWRRQTDSGKRDVRVTYADLRVIGDERGGTVPVTVHLPRDTAEQYQGVVRKPGESLSALLGSWLDVGFKRHMAREGRRRYPPPING